MFPYVECCFHKWGGYVDKVLIKIGMKEPIIEEPVIEEPVIETDWTLVGWERCMDYLDYDADIVFFGDSITSGGNFSKYYPDKKIVNFGIPGDTILGLQNKVEILKSVSPEKLFVLVGINSLTDTNIDECTQWYDALISNIQAELPTTQIYIESVLPISLEKERVCVDNVTIRNFNENLDDIADRYKCQYIDLYSLYEEDGYMNPILTKDGVHLKDEAYDIWAKAIEGAIYE